MYTSMKLIYGVPFTKAHADVIRSWPKGDPRHKGGDPEFIDELELYGFVGLPGLDGYGYPIGYVGAVIASCAVIPGCPVKLDELDVGPVFADRDGAWETFNHLDPELQGVGVTPGLYLIPWES